MGRLEKEAFGDITYLRLETSKERMTTIVQPPGHQHVQLSECFFGDVSAGENDRTL